MKTLKFTLIILMSVSLFTACNNDEEETPSIDESIAELEAVYDDSFEEVDAIVESSLSFFDVSGRIAEEEEDVIIRCGIKTHDFENKTITIDFGDGCEGRGGRMREGKIIITYTDRKFVPGSEAVVTFEDFYVNGIKVEGVRTRTNVNASLDENPSFNITLEGGKLIWPDGTVAERDVNHTRTWYRATNPLNDEYTVTGTATGMNRNGVAYTITILTPIKYKRACWASNVFIPVEGVKLVEREGFDDVEINYGDGSCDNTVEASKNGFTRQFQIRNRFGRGN